VLSNLSSVGSGVADSVLADNAITLTNTALPLADLAVTALDAPDPVLLGQQPGLHPDGHEPWAVHGPEYYAIRYSSRPGEFSFGHPQPGYLHPCWQRRNLLARIDFQSSQRTADDNGQYTNAGFITNLVSVSTTTTDPNLANNSANTVTKVNSPPFISTLANQIINEDTSTGPLAFTIRDLETAASALVFTASSSNPGLVANSSFIYGGSGSNRTLSILPLTNQFGTGTITVQVLDADGATNRTSFLLTVNSVNDPPTLSPISDLTIFKSSGAQMVNLTGITDGPTNETQVLTVAAISSQPGLIPIRQ